MKCSPSQKQRTLSRRKKGLILIFTGDGKGKTSAALGTAMRCAGARMRSCMIQFIKGTWKCGEHAAARKLSPYFEIKTLGSGFVRAGQDSERHLCMARKAWDLGRNRMMSGRYDLVIFDEINCAIRYGYLKAGEVIEALKQKPCDVHVILTGREAHPRLVRLADVVTEMKEIKHPFRKGILAQRGIDF